VRSEEEDAFIACPFCASRLYLDRAAAVRHEMLLPVVVRGELPSRLGRWLSDVEALGRPEKVSTRLLFFPFWVLPAGGSSRLEPAAALLAHGLAGFGLPAGDLKAFREGAVNGAEVVPATILLERFATPRDPVAARGSARRGDARLVHLPFWEISFRIGSREQRVWLDAAGGRVLPLTVPASSSGRLDRTYSIVFGVAFAVLFCGFLALFRGGGASIAGLAVLCAGGPAALWAARAAIRGAEEP
jgi:hypothetical protein